MALSNLPEDNDALKALVAALLRERDAEKQRANELHIENLRLQVELDRYKKQYYGPRAYQLQSADDLAQLLLNFAGEVDRKPVNPEDVPAHSEPQEQLRRVKRGGVERKEIGAEESWQMEYLPGHFERLHHVRKNYACPSCEINGDSQQMETAVKPDAAIEMGMAGPGLVASIVTSKFSDYLPLYRLEDIFAHQGFEISRATQSVWCGDVADLVEPCMS